MASHEKLYEKMLQSKAGWGLHDLDRLYRGYGFECSEGGKHVIYIHPEFRALRATVARHRSLPVGYIQHALHLINELKRRKGESNG